MRLFLAVSALALGCAQPSPPVVTLAPLPSSSSSSGPSGAELAARAEACFAEPTCALATASRDFVRADDAGAVPLACLRFYYGTGVPRDLVRARRCLARTTVAACDGSPDLDRLLASMEVSGQGGPVDRAAARALLAPCFADVSVQGVLEAKPTPDFDFCRDVGGTTLGMTECTTLSIDRANFRFAGWRKSIEPKLGPVGSAAREKLARADAAFAAFSLADAARAGDAFRGGSLENLTYAGQRVTLLEGRAARFEDAFAAPPPVDVARATSWLRTTDASARVDLDAEGAKLFDGAAAAFEGYVDAEVALWVELGANPGAVRAWLLYDRVKELP